jgi:hypothetical protein
MNFENDAVPATWARAGAEVAGCERDVDLGKAVSGEERR